MTAAGGAWFRTEKGGLVNLDRAFVIKATRAGDGWTVMAEGNGFREPLGCVHTEEQAELVADAIHQGAHTWAAAVDPEWVP